MSFASQVVASAPGKLILMGEHAAVYRRPALVVAIGLRTSACLTLRQDRRVRLMLRDLDVDETLSWDEIARYGDAARSAWTTYAAGSAVRDLDRLRAADPGHVVKTALAETARAIGSDLPGIDVDLSSELPVGSGFGSSASVAVATIGALLALAAGEAEPAVVESLALDVERRQHGRPSGIDHGTVLRGGVQWAEWREGGELRCETLALSPGFLERLAVFHTGKPAESTGVMVESVRHRFEDRPAELEAILDGMGSKTLELRDLLTGKLEHRRINRLVRLFQRDLEALGVVPEPLKGIVRDIETLGGAAKISGAGGLAGPAAGSLLVYQPEEPLTDAACLAPMRRLNMALGVPGLEVRTR